MGAKSTIEWTDATWSPLRVRVRVAAAQIARLKGYTSLIQISEKMAGRVGQHCEHVSDGCKLCYSGTWQGRCLTSGGTGLPFDRRSRDLIEPFVDEQTLIQPLKWQPIRLHEDRCGKTVLGKQAACTCRGPHQFRPKKIFVENQSDLFGEWYSDEQIDRVFAVMALCPQHTFQVLTKRPERMLAYVNGIRWDENANERGEQLQEQIYQMSTDETTNCLGSWPLPNVWLGVSVEDQKTADARIPILLRTPAAKRFVSYEPALAVVDFSEFMCDCSESGMCNGRHAGNYPLSRLDWIIVGGESGPGSRPFDIAWARNTIKQCKAAGVPCFVKQFGSKPLPWMEMDTARVVRLKDRKGGDMSEWPEDLRVREFPIERRAV